MSTRPTLGAFNQGELPTIAGFNKATVPFGVDLGALIAAMQVYIDEHVAPVWGTPAKLIKTTRFQKGLGRWCCSTPPISPTLWPTTI